MLELHWKALGQGGVLGRERERERRGGWGGGGGELGSSVMLIGEERGRG